jgi:hypothetical protein
LEEAVAWPTLQSFNPLILESSNPPIRNPGDAEGSVRYRYLDWISMQNHFRHPQSPLESSRKYMLEHLKMCPLCHTVNSKLNRECFVCRWHGGFVHDADVVENGLIEVLEQCPELIDCILTIPPRRTVMQRISDFIRRITRRRLDLEV